MFTAVTCHFNPQGYRRIVENYWKFRSQLSAPLVTVELSFNGRFEIPDSIQISGNARQHVMWQKERLLNHAIAELPDQFDTVAWIDADLLFLNGNWLHETLALLEKKPVVQLFERTHDLNAYGRIERTLHSWAKVYNSAELKGTYGRPGGAWAARREVIPEGLYDANIIGGGDHSTLSAWNGTFEHAPTKGESTSWTESYRAWAQRQYERVKGEIGCVSGEIVHSYHGERENRKYVDRYRALTDYNFDPQQDIVIDNNGAWRWNSDKPEMHLAVAQYFSERQEDDAKQAKMMIAGNKSSPARPKKTASERKPAELRNITRWSVGVTTAPRKQETLEQTLDSLNDAGFALDANSRDFTFRLFAEPDTQIPRTFQHLPVTQHSETLGAFPNFYLGLAELVQREPKADGYLMCQDDVLFARGTRQYLESTLWPEPIIGVVSLYCPSHYDVGQQTGWHCENRGWKSWGALAYLFSNESARAFLSDPLVLAHRGYGPAKGMRNVDSVVGSFCERHNRNYYVHVPSLAQHIGETSTIWPRGRAAGQRIAKQFVQDTNKLPAAS